MSPNQWGSKLGSIWVRFPEQVKRLTVVIVVLAAVFIPVRRMLVPGDFGRHGHYRAGALSDAAALPEVYAGQAVCNDCHDDVVATKAAGYHASAACEGCHGACLAHTEYPDSVIPPAPRDRGYCVLCHEYLESRPTGFPQIVSASHYPLKPCYECHDPHDPAPAEATQECTACHAAIGRTKAASEHVYLECTRCHQVPDEHRIKPLLVRASKPSSRELCGECHARDAAGEASTPRIDMASHGKPYVCWQCHYPHNPEAE